MKKHIIILAAIFAAALLAPACSPEEVQGPKDEGLTISLFSGDLETKAYNSSFETAIDHFDFFFFEDEAGTTPIPGMHGRVTSSSSVTLDTRPGKTYEALRKRESYVYILANYPDAIDHRYDMALYEILALPVNYKIMTGTTTVVTDGVSQETVTFNDNLVMDSYHKDGTTEKRTVKISAPTKFNEARTVNVELTRLAAKLILKVNVPTNVPGSMNGEIWTPILEDLEAYFVNALNNKTKVDGQPIQRSLIPNVQQGNYEYLAYPNWYPIKSTTASPRSFTADPVFTYPQKWAHDENGEPYFKIHMVWESNFRGTDNFYYKVRVPKPVNGYCTIERNACYTVTVDLSVIDTENEYVELEGTYSIVPWAEGLPAGGDGMAAARFFNVPVTVYDLFNQAELTIPVYSSSAVTAYFDEISYTHYGPKSKTDHTFAYPYSWKWDPSANKNSVVLTAGDATATSAPTEVLTAAKDLNRYSLTVADNNKSITFTHSLNKVYTLREIHLTIKNEEGKNAQVIIRQHPAIEIRKIPAKNAFVNGHFARNDKDTKDMSGNLVGTMWGPTEEYDSGLMKYHSNEYLEQHHLTTPTTHSPIFTINLADQGLANIYSDWSASVKSGQVFLTEITVSAFDQTNNSYVVTYNGDREEYPYLIGDPRVPASDYYDYAENTQTRPWLVTDHKNFWLPEYLKRDSQLRVRGSEEDGWEYDTQTFDHGEWEEPLQVLIASQGTDARNVIAPKFLVSSSLNGMNPGITFDGSVRRAATYQENGYPAGRWRLPTEAEVAFIAARQLEGLIPQLFVQGSSTSYLCANRSYVKLGSNFSPSTGITAGPVTENSSTYFNRFVYDLWYWGDDPVDEPDQYHPNMHQH